MQLLHNLLSWLLPPQFPDDQQALWPGWNACSHLCVCQIGELVCSAAIFFFFFFYLKHVQDSIFVWHNSVTSVPPPYIWQFLIHVGWKMKNNYLASSVYFIINSILYISSWQLKDFKSNLLFLKDQSLNQPSHQHAG